MGVQMVLSFALPFGLVPLLKFTSSPLKMGPYVNPYIVSGVKVDFCTCGCSTVKAEGDTGLG